MTEKVMGLDKYQPREASWIRKNLNNYPESIQHLGKGDSVKEKNEGLGFNSIIYESRGPS